MLGTLAGAGRRRRLARRATRCERRPRCRRRGRDGLVTLHERSRARRSQARTPSTPTCGCSMGDEDTAAERRAALAPYRVDDALLDAAAPGAIALHDLPAHPGEEITAEVLYGPRQRIWDQAENRRHAQKALLELLADRGAGDRAPAVDATASAAQRARARRRAGAARSTRWPSAARASRASATAATSCSSPARSPAIACARVVYKRKRSYAHARTIEMLEPEPRAHRAAADAPGRALAGAPLRAPARDQAGAGRRGAAADRAPGGLRAGADRARRGAVALPQQARVLLRRRTERRRARMRLPRSRRRQQREPIDDCLLASEPATSPATVALRWCRAAGAARLGSWPQAADAARAERAARTAPAPAPTGARCCATSSCARAAARQAAGAPRHHRRASSSRRARRPRSARSSASSSQRRAVDALATASPRRPPAARPSWSGAMPSCPSASASSTCASPPRRSSRPTPRWPSVLYGIVAEYAALEGWERVYDLYCGIGTIAPDARAARRRAVGHRAGRAGRRRRDRRRAAQRDHQRQLLRRRHPPGAARAASQRAGRPDVLVVDPPRAGLSKKVVRRIIEASPKRIVYVSCNPTTLAPNAAELVEAGWTLRRCGRWTCSRRRTTSSASRCSSGLTALARSGLRIAAATLGFRADARRHHPRAGDRDRGAPRPGAGSRRGARARARGGAERRAT